MKQSVRKDLPYLDPPCSDTSNSDDDAKSQKAILVDSKDQMPFCRLFWKMEQCQKINGSVPVIVEKFYYKKEISAILQICDAFQSKRASQRWGMWPFLASLTVMVGMLQT